jgi:hypothetical protein
MAKYTATIQLHDAGSKDFETLNAELAKESFVEDKRSSDKMKKDLSRKEYSREGNISLQEVNASIFKAASRTGKKYSFTVLRNKHAYN